MEPISIIVWTYALVFSATATLTLTGLIEGFPWIRVKEKYMKVLFAMIIGEIAVGGIAVATGFLDSKVNNEEVQTDLEVKNDQLTQEVNALQSELDVLRSELEKIQLTDSDKEQPANPPTPTPPTPPNPPDTRDIEKPDWNADGFNHTAHYSDHNKHFELLSGPEFDEIGRSVSFTVHFDDECKDALAALKILT